jgi:serine/threonine-protein kinase
MNDPVTRPGVGRLAGFLAELRRRRVIRALFGWAVVSFAALQVAEPLMHALDLKDWVLKVVVAVLAAGFPVAAILSWFFDLGPGGVTRTPEKEPGPTDVPPAQRKRVLVVLVGASALVGAGVAFLALRSMDREPAGKPSMAVLPFADMSPGKDQEYLSDGIAEEIRSALSRVEGLRVAGRTSSAFFKGRNATLADIGRELDVGTVLEGGVRRDGDRLRITATILRTADGAQVWSASWDKGLKDILAVENEIAREVVEVLKVRLLGGGRPSVPGPQRTSAEAHLHELRGREAFLRGSVEDLRRAVAEYEASLKLDPGLAAAWAGLALALDYDAENEKELEGLLAKKRKAVDAAERAVAARPDAADGYFIRGTLRGIYRHEWKEARADVERGLALSPDSALGHVTLGRVLAVEGRLAEALSEARRAVELDPLYPFALLRVGFYATATGDLELARGAFERVLEISPDHSSAAGFLAQLHVVAGRPQDALAVAARSHGQSGWRLQAVALAEHSLGHVAASRSALDDFVARYSHNMPFQIAEVFAWRGDADAAFQWLDRAEAQMDLGLLFVTYSPFLASIRGDPRYVALLRRLNLAKD